jgi:hypothetical protein
MSDALIAMKNILINMVMWNAIVVKDLILFLENLIVENIIMMNI